jgi:hypothetical protein
VFKRDWKECVNKSNRPFQSPLLLVTEPLVQVTVVVTTHQSTCSIKRLPSCVVAGYQNLDLLVEVWLQYFLTFGTRWRWGVTVKPLSLFSPPPQKSGPQYQIDRRLSGPQSWSGPGGKRKVSVLIKNLTSILWLYSPYPNPVVWGTRLIVRSSHSFLKARDDFWHPYQTVGTIVGSSSLTQNVPGNKDKRNFLSLSIVFYLCDNIVTFLMVHVTNNLRNTSDDWIYYTSVTLALFNYTQIPAVQRYSWFTLFTIRRC